MEVLRPKKLKEKLPPGRQPKFSQEYMIMVARKVADEGMTYSKASKIFDISEGAIGAWVKNYKTKNWGNASKNKKVSEEIHKFRTETQINDLKHEIAELYLENLMLKKTLQFSQQIKKENSSVITSQNLDQFKKAAK